MHIPQSGVRSQGRRNARSDGVLAAGCGMFWTLRRGILPRSVRLLFCPGLRSLRLGLVGLPQRLGMSLSLGVGGVGLVTGLGLRRFQFRFFGSSLSLGLGLGLGLGGAPLSLLLCFEIAGVVIRAAVGRARILIRGRNGAGDGD